MSSEESCIDRRRRRRHGGDASDESCSPSRKKMKQGHSLVSSGDDKKSRRKHHKKRSSSDRKRRHRKHPSSSSSEENSSDDESSYERRRRKRKDKKSKKKRKKRSRKDGTDFEPNQEVPVQEVNNFGAEVHPQSQQDRASPAEVALQEAEDRSHQPRKGRAMVPMSKEQYDAEQSKIREVYDEESGRYRLVRGSGEIIERIVSQADHARINQTATRGDGASYARSIFQQASRRR